MANIAWVYEGSSKGYFIKMNGETVHFNADERDRDMFVAELKLRAEKIAETAPSASTNTAYKFADAHAAFEQIKKGRSVHEELGFRDGFEVGFEAARHIC